MSSIKKYVYTVPLDIIHYIYKFLDVKTVFSKSMQKFIYCFGLFTDDNEPLYIDNNENHFSFKDFFFIKKRQTPKLRRRLSIVNDVELGIGLETQTTETTQTTQTTQTANNQEQTDS